MYMHFINLHKNEDRSIWFLIVLLETPDYTYIMLGFSWEQLTWKGFKQDVFVYKEAVKKIITFSFLKSLFEINETEIMM